jgi:hypothetical protein
MPHQSDLTPEMSERFLSLQLELECTRIEQGNLLVPFPCADPDLPARVLVVEYDSVYVLYLRQDLPFALRQRVQELGPQRAFSDGEHVRAILAENAPCEDIWSGVRTSFLPRSWPRLHQMWYGSICSVTVPCLKRISQSEVLARASHTESSLTVASSLHVLPRARTHERLRPG